MTRNWIPTLAIAMLVWAAPALAGQIDDDLQDVLDSMGPDDVVSTLVFLAQQVDIDTLSATLDAQGASRQERHETVVLALQAMADSTQGSVVTCIEELIGAGDVESYQAFWISNVIRVDAKKAGVNALGARQDVGTIYLNYEMELVEPVSTAPAPLGQDPEPGLVAINADDAWALGVTGSGVLVANLDTGVDGHHPALANRWAGVADLRYRDHPEWAWYAPYQPDTEFPHGGGFKVAHGTHVMGTLCGGKPGDQIGVAPDAFWAAAAPLRPPSFPIEYEVFHSAVVDSLQWIADPDGQSATVWDVPHVCCNSYVMPLATPQCDSNLWSPIDNCEAVGVVILFAAGNLGTDPLRSPVARADTKYNTLAVGAVDAAWVIADFSSRGETPCTTDPTLKPKPELVGPGVDVRSAIPGYKGTLYQVSDGTSMAAPHVTGVAALILQACDQLTVAEVKQIMYDTAYDLGEPGDDAVYGWGMVDAVAAVQVAFEMCGALPPRAYDVYAETTLNHAVEIQLSAWDEGEPDPPQEVDFIIVTLAEHGRLVDPNGGVIETVPYTLIGHENGVQYWPFAFYTGEDEFTWKANDGGEPPYGGDSEVASAWVTIRPIELEYAWLYDDTNPGWQTDGQWAFGEPQGSGGPNGPADPTSGYTGDNVYGYNLAGAYPSGLVDPQHVTSAAFDCSELTQVTLRYWRRLGVQASEQDHARIDVSIDGYNWDNAWENRSYWYTGDYAWLYHEVDLSSWADSEHEVQLRWTMGPTSSGYPCCGWNIDDIGIWGVKEYPGECASPDDVEVIRGSMDSGLLVDAFYSDDERLVVESVVPSGPEPDVVMEVMSTSPILVPDQLKFSLEAGPIEAGVYSQTIELYNYLTESYTEVYSGPAPQGDHTPNVPAITFYPQRFIDQTTGEVKARLSWKVAGGNEAYTVGIDQVVLQVVDN